MQAGRFAEACKVLGRITKAWKRVDIITNLAALLCWLCVLVTKSCERVSSVISSLAKKDK